MELTHNDVKSIIEIIDGAEHLEEVEITYGNFHIHVSRGGEGMRSIRAATPGPVTAGPTQRPAVAGPGGSALAKSAEVTFADDEIVIRAPMLGTFYRSASPGEKPFVEVGQKVSAGDTVCVIEVMKLFSSIEAGINGTVTKILVENASLVEFNQVLMVITPPATAGN